ncbi:PREDICTED: probable cytochrome P450 6a14, partial [Rhagoletis zephyria]|uniref:probable cytochrome P450 6a14 n=1 Tax=Rhagoletis zephyria TaxID=28612 RepID=UPI0008118C4F
MGFTERAFDYFAKLTKSILKQRRESSGKRGDLVQLLMDAYVYENDLKNASYENLTANTEQEESTEEALKGVTGQSSNKVKRTLTENELISQLIVFFVAGFETTSSTITNCIFELVSNPSVQERLHQELTTSLAGIDPESEQYYDVVMGQIPYLDAVVKETLRKYPALVRFDRTNKIDGYKLGNLTLDAGVLVECSP